MRLERLKDPPVEAFPDPEVRGIPGLNPAARYMAFTSIASPGAPSRCRYLVVWLSRGLYGRVAGALNGGSGPFQRDELLVAPEEPPEYPARFGE